MLSSRLMCYWATGEEEASAALSLRLTRSVGKEEHEGEDEEA